MQSLLATWWNGYAKRLPAYSQPLQFIGSVAEWLAVPSIVSSLDLFHYV